MLISFPGKEGAESPEREEPVPLSAHCDKAGLSSQLKDQLCNTTLCVHNRDASFSVQKQLKQEH